jgi:hypothetical protein
MQIPRDLSSTEEGNVLSLDCDAKGFATHTKHQTLTTATHVGFRELGKEVLHLRYPTS